MRIITSCCLFFILLICCQANKIKAQTPDTTTLTSNASMIKVTGDYRGVRITDLLLILQKRYNVRFYFDPALVPNYEVFLQFRQRPFFDVMQDILDGTNLTCAQLKPGILLIAPKTNLSRQYADAILQAWENGDMSWPSRQAFKELSLSFGSTNNSNAKNLVFKGIISDLDTGEPITGATLLDTKTQKGTDTDLAGRFELSLPAGEHNLDIQYIGYQPIKLKLSLYESAQTALEMEQLAFNLEEVVIKAKTDNSNVRTTQIGVENLAIKSIKELPTLLGEADVIRSLETLPGVSTVGEGAAGFNVRGGNIDQNLIIQDGAPIFNTAHALGFFSAFNPDVINGISLYKGSIPAQYGGRLSSVLEVRIKDGDYQKTMASGGVGLAYSRLAIEGPIFRNQTSFLLGGRFSYSNWMLRLIRNPQVKYSAISFYDITGKISHRINEKHLLSLSGFWSSDGFQYSNEFGYDWETRSSTFSWNYLITEKISSAFKAIRGEYSSALFEPSGDDAFRLSNSLKYQLLKENIFFQPNEDYQINVGAEWTRYQTDPERLNPENDNSVVVSQQVPKDNGYEWAAYANAEINLSERWALSAGLRFSQFQQTGARSVFLYDPAFLKESGNIIDTLRFGKGKPIQAYAGWEPRVALKYQIGPDNALKAGYNRLRQYIHLVSNTAASTPVDLWQVSTLHIPPQAAHSFSLGYFHNFQKNLWQLSIEGYYKILENLIVYKDLPRLLLNESIETELLAGDGKAYGVELSVRKTSGKWSGQLAYTFSRSLQRSAGKFPTEIINQGEWFPSNFDQPHQINLSLKRQVNPTQSFSINFAYKSGRPFTIPTANYLIGGVVVSQYSPRNEGRIPAYHRVDFAFNVDKTGVKEKGLRNSFTFSVYNVYSRKNAFSVFYQRNERNQQEVYRLAIIGTALPAFTWNFIF